MEVWRYSYKPIATTGRWPMRSAGINPVPASLAATPSGSAVNSAKTQELS